MNVKPGDLAVTVSKSNHPTAIANSGRLVEVLRYVGVYEFADGSRESDIWFVKLLGGKLADVVEGKEWGPNVYIGDRNLRPIRDPGDDARDESAVWLPPVPTVTPVKETAMHGNRDGEQA